MVKNELQKAATKQIEWAIGFAQADLKNLREGDWLNLEDELLQFLRQDRPFATLLTKSALIYTELREQIPALQKMIKKRFEELVEGKYSSVEGIFYLQAHPGEPYEFILVSTKLGERTRMMLDLHLANSGIVGGQIRRCPQCRRMFVVKRKPAEGYEFYCSTKCKNRAAYLERRG